MNELRFLLRAKRLAQNPPPLWKVKLVIGVIVVLLAVAGIERFVGWPEWMSLEPAGRRNILR